MSKETLHILAGAIVVAAGTLAFILSHQGGPTEKISGYPLSAQFSAVDGVGIGTKVLLTGIPVGDVGRMYYDDKSERAVLDFVIRPDIKIPADSVALIVTDGLLGAKYIKIQPGGDEEMLKPGDAFEYVQGSIAFEEILEKVIVNAEQKRREEKKEKPEKDKQADPNRVMGPPAQSGRTVAEAGNLSDGVSTKK